MKKDFNTKNGFTLVEMMVAIAVFSIVMVTAASALLNVIDANRKAQAIQIAINNINFALEGISKDMRMGTEYACLSADGSYTTADCPEGGQGIRYRSVRAYLDENTGKRGYAYYKLDGVEKQIVSCVQEGFSDCASDNEFSPITSKDLAIENFKFYVLNNGVNDGLQPRAVITLGGTAGVRENIKTSFDLQTSVSQRSRISN